MGSNIASYTVTEAGHFSHNNNAYNFFYTNMAINLSKLKMRKELESVIIFVGRFYFQKCDLEMTFTDRGCIILPLILIDFY